LVQGHFVASEPLAQLQNFDALDQILWIVKIF
jgi:hypothetical protein